MNIVGYVRVSTEEQASSGVSLAIQREKLEIYCRLHDLELVGVEADEGVSAKNLDRPGLQRVFARMRSGEADGMVIAKLDRLSRSVADWDHLIGEFFGERGTKQLCSVADSIDTRTAAGRLVLNMLMSVAQWERETISERVREAMQYVKAKGDRAGQIPYGRRLVNPADRDDTTMEDDPDETAVIEHILWMTDAGSSSRAVARRLTELQIPTKTDRNDDVTNLRPWQASTILAIIERIRPCPQKTKRPRPRRSSATSSATRSSGAA